MKFLLAVRRRVKYALRTSNDPPQTDALVCIFQTYCLANKDAGCWKIDSEPGKKHFFIHPVSLEFFRL
jgi:hypothetical protein